MNTLNLSSTEVFLGDISRHDLSLLQYQEHPYQPAQTQQAAERPGQNITKFALF